MVLRSTRIRPSSLVLALISRILSFSIGSLGWLDLKTFLLLLHLLILDLAPVTTAAELPTPSEPVVPVYLDLFSLDHMLTERDHLLCSCLSSVL